MTERDLDRTSTFLLFALPDAVLAKLSAYKLFRFILLLIYGVFCLGFTSGALMKVGADYYYYGY